MQEIRKSYYLIDKLIEANLNCDNYVPSKYNISISYDDNNYIVFNSLTRGIVLLSEEENTKLIDVHNNTSLCNDAIQFLIKNHYIVDAQIDETKRYFELYKTIKAFEPISTKKRKFKIYTTTYCNARCFYCFEEGIKRQTMTMDTADSVVQYIIKEKVDEKIELYWFGGEPLCNQSVIDYICSELSKNNVDFTSSIITNGYLFNQENIKKSVINWKLSFAEITLDGFGETHNKRKNYINPKSDPFEKTLENIHFLDDMNVNVLVRLNFDINNLESIKKLISFLTEDFVCSKNITIVPAMLMDDCFCYRNNTNIENQKVLYQELYQMRDFLKEKHFLEFTTLSDRFLKNHCMADNPSCSVINTDGRLFTCQSTDEKMCYGDIYNGITNSDVLDKWHNPKTIRNKCYDCCYLPECSPFDMCPAQNELCKMNYSFTVNRKLRATAHKLINKGKI